MINRKLFTEAGLNPNQPPTTWAEVERDARAIAALGHGIYGYGDYSASPGGGWHFTSEMDAMGGQIVGANGQAAFDNSTNAPQATASLQALHQMRFFHHSMSPTPQLALRTLQQQIAAN